MRKIIPVVAAGTTALALAGGSFEYAAAAKDVTLSVDGATTQVSSRAATVAEVLQTQGVKVGQHDVVAPEPSAPVADGTRIAVRYGRPVTVKVDGRQRTHWTTATRVGQALAALNVNTSGAAVSASPSAVIGRQGVALDIATLKTVTLDVAGWKQVVKTTGRRVADALKQAKVTVDADDRLSAPPTALLSNGATVTYTKVDTRTLTKKKKVSYDTVRHRTSRLKKGVTRVETSGRPGTRTVTYREVRHNGRVASLKKIDSEVTTKAQTKIVLVGTRVVVHHTPAEVAPVSRPAKAQRTQNKPKVRLQTRTQQTHRKAKVRKAVVHRASPKRSSAPRAASGGVWDKIARCESGGNWHINTGNGFYGGLQFTRSTWRAYGGSGMPHQASRSRQIAVAKRVQASQGWGAWPACTSKLGLR